MNDKNMVYRPTAIKIKTIEWAGHVECIQILCFWILSIVLFFRTHHPVIKIRDGVLDNVQKDKYLY
jgi:hypothetical protein